MRLARIRAVTALLGFIAFALSLGLASSARADSWAMPRTTTVTSTDGRYRLTVEPAPIESPLDYLTEELEAAREGRVVERPAPLAVFERRNAGGDYEPVWAKPLVNQIAPVEFMISMDGNRIVTLDNWQSVGHGEHVIAIYDEAGDLVRSMQLSEFLPVDYIEALPHSVSSVHWRDGERFSDDGSTLLVDVVVPSAGEEQEGTVERAIDLRDGSVIEPVGDRWAYALDRARQKIAMLNQAEARRIAYLTEPLAAPTSTDVGSWHEYLREAFLRLTPNYFDDPVAATKVLFAPSHERFETSVEWLVDAFRGERDFPGEVAVASPASADALIEALARAADAVPDNSLIGSTIYLSISADRRGEAEMLVRRTGATFVWLDPTQAIPQRPERIPGSAAKVAADEERMRRSEKEMRDLLDELDSL